MPITWPSASTLKSKALTRRAHTPQALLSAIVTLEARSGTPTLCKRRVGAMFRSVLPSGERQRSLMFCYIRSMNPSPISRPTVKSLESLARLMVQPSEDVAAIDLSRGFKSAGIPERLVSAAGDNESLMIAGDEFREFMTAHRLLVGESLTEHLSPREIETQLWDLSCELVVERDKYANANERKSRVTQFIAEITKAWEPFECAFSIADLRVECPEMQIGGARFVQWAGVPVDWRLRGPDDARDEFMKGTAGNCMAITTVMSGDIAQAVARARGVVDSALDVLRLGITETVHVRVLDSELAFRRSEFELIRRQGDENAAQLNWNFGRRNVTATISESRAKAIEDYLAPVVGTGVGLPEEFAERIRLAARWIGASALKPELDDKVVALCTAVEALLASKSDRLKGEIIAIRSMLLPLSIGEGFTDPFPLYALYNRRSDVIHGSRLGVCGEEDYRLLRFEGTLILKRMVSVLKQHPEVQRFDDLVRLIETVEGLGHAEAWFRRYGPAARDVVKAAQERRRALEPMSMIKRMRSLCAKWR